MLKSSYFRRKFYCVLIHIIFTVKVLQSFTIGAIVWESICYRWMILSVRLPSLFVRRLKNSVPAAPVYNIRCDLLLFYLRPVASARRQVVSVRRQVAILTMSFVRFFLCEIFTNCRLCCFFCWCWSYSLLEVLFRESFTYNRLYKCVLR